MEKLGEFFSKYAGLIIGGLVGIVLIATRLTQLILDIIIIVCFAYLGKYIHANGNELKEKVKKIVEKW